MRTLLRTMWGALIRAAVPAAAVTLLAGCAGVPSSSPARVADPLPANARPPERLTQSFVVVKPERGDTSRDIVSKFITAQANPERSHGVARQFLTPGAQDAWDDTGQVRVIDANPYVRSVSPDNDVAVAAHQVGTVATNGSYNPDEGAYAYTFHLVRVHGQWRIDNPPHGVIVSAGDFQNVYRQYSLYYLDQAEKHVIGDLRYFASTSTSSSTSQATLFLRLLQQPPSTALGDAVRSELVGGVQLVGNVVQGSDKVLRVYLTGLGVRSAAVRSAAVAQIVWTLSQLASSGVSIFDDGQRLDIQGVTQPTQQSDWQSFDPDTLPVNTGAYFLHAGALYSADGNRVPGPAGRGDYALSSVAVSLATDSSPTPRVAGVSAASGQARLYVGQLGRPLTLRLRAHTLTSLTWDSIFDEVWAIRDGRVVRVPRRGAPAPVDSQSLDSLGPVRTLRLSRDGSRVAIVAGDPGQLYLARVGRDNGQVAVEGPVDVAPSLADVDGVSWESATTLLVLASGPGDDRMLRTVSVDGAVMKSETKSGLPGPPVRVATAPNLPAVAESDGSLWQRTGDHWTNLVRGSTVEGSDPIYPD
ncbi:MAG TPA: LpqB family beta-propeller domain-containing protein [Mycobacteriales bacterium]|nr:LpqB family beta-propeller domain-containing protein [Mycobacteriales bacterium]